jgi:hypothetical protein
MSSPGGTRRAIVSSALIALGLTALIVSGAWGAKLKTRSATITVDEVEPTTATCPRPTKAISGGFEGDHDVDDPNSAEIAPLGSGRSGKRGWEARGFSRGPVEGELTVYAYCRAEKVKERSTSVTLEPPPPGQAEAVSLTAKCPRGTKAVSGGFDNPDAFSMGSSGALVFTHQSLKRGKRRWLVSGSNLSNEETTYEAFVYCRDGQKLKTKAKDGTAGSNDELELTAKCGRKQRVVSGGFDLVEPKVGGAGPLAVESRKQGRRRWVIEVVNTGDPVGVTAFAYCEEA